MHRAIEIDEARLATRQLLALARQLFVPADDSAAQLPLGQLRVCAILFAGPRPMSELSRELGISTSAATQIADRLERAGLVRRITGEPDRRVRRLQLTERAARIVGRREQARIDRMSNAWRLLSDGQRQEALAALATLLRACTEANRPTASGGNGAADTNQHMSNDHPSDGPRARRPSAKSAL